MINWVQEYSEEELNTMITRLVDGVVDGIIDDEGKKYGQYKNLHFD